MVGYATRLLRSFVRCAISCIEARFAHFYELMRDRLVASLAFCLPIRSQPMKKRTTPIYATRTSPVMCLLCPPKFCISIIFNFSWDGCNIKEKWKTPWKVMQNLGGQIRCIMGDVQVTNPAILTEQAWSIKYLFYCQIIVVFIHNGLSCCYLVFYK